MKTLLIPLVLWLVVAGALSALEARVGAVGSPTGSYGLEAVGEGGLEFFEDTLNSEWGLEASLSGTQPRLLIPVGLALEVYLDEGWSAGIALHGLAGLTLAATPEVLWGGEAEARVEFAWVPGLALGFSLGVRNVGASWEFPIHLLVELPFGADDKLDLPDESGGSPEEGH